MEFRYDLDMMQCARFHEHYFGLHRCDYCVAVVSFCHLRNEATHITHGLPFCQSAVRIVAINSQS